MVVNWRELVRAGSLKLEPGIRCRQVPANRDQTGEAGVVVSPGVVVSQLDGGLDVVDVTWIAGEFSVGDIDLSVEDISQIDLIDCGATRGAILDQLRERWGIPNMSLVDYGKDRGGWVLSEPPDELAPLADPSELTLLLKAIAVPRVTP